MQNAFTPSTCRDWLQKFPDLFVDSVGDLDRKVSIITAPDLATAGSAVFLSTPKALKAGIESPATVLVVNQSDRAKAEEKLGDRTLLISKNAEWAMAKVLSAYFRATPFVGAGIVAQHPSAVVAKSATIDTTVRIGPHAFIGENVVIGAGAVIGTNCVIEDGAEIGENSVIQPLAYIGPFVVIGKRCEIGPQTVIGKEGFGYANDEKFNHIRIPHIGRVVIEDEVHIGSQCVLDRGTFGETRIGLGTKIDNLVHIAHNSQIGRNGLVTAGFIVAGSTRIGSNFVTGGRTSIAGHIEICDGVQLAGMSVVGKTITKPGQYGGNPLQPIKMFLKNRSSLAHLTDMRKQIGQILRHLGIEERPSETADEA